MIFTKRGKITQLFLQNYTPLYKEAGLIGHTAVDWTNGFGKSVITDNPGVVYKVIRNTDGPSNWQGVYIICPNGSKRFMELCFGHLSEVLVQEGDHVLAGQIIGKEGNFGDVFSNGQRITAQMQRQGDTRGSHVHEMWRPVTQTKNPRPNDHLLRKANGFAFEDANGQYVIDIDSPETKGTIDPLNFLIDQSVSEKKLSFLKTVLSYVFGLKAKKK